MAMLMEPGFAEATKFGDPLMPEWVSAENTTGTSIMAAEFDGGVVIGADSRTTTGAYISNRVTDKLTKVTDYIYCCRSGSAADTQAIADIVSYHLDFHQALAAKCSQGICVVKTPIIPSRSQNFIFENFQNGLPVEVLPNYYMNETGEPPLVQAAANVFRELCYNYRDSLMAGMIVAGWDKRKGGQVYSVPIGGMCVRQNLAIGGSGSTYVYGYVDANFKLGMSKQKCMEFVTNTLALAMSRDGSSGGVVRLGVITKDKIERFTILKDQLPTFYEG